MYIIRRGGSANMVYFILILIALAFGVVEGISEWLPISSTGHMILLDGFMKMANFDIAKEFNFSQGFFSMFLVVIQLGAILAVVVYFFPKLWPFGKKKISEEEKVLIEKGEIDEKSLNKQKHKDIWLTWAKTIIGVLPAAIVGLILEILDVEIENWISVSITLIFYGIAFILVEFFLKKKNKPFKVNSIKDLSIKYAFFIGCFQVLALIPGTSRSGVTILGALLLGLSRESAAEFSFYLSIPVMVGASLLRFVKYLLDYGAPNLNEWLFLLVGMVSAFIVSIFAVKWLMGFVKKHDFKPFGIYRIALGLLVIAIFCIYCIYKGR